MENDSSAIRSIQELKNLLDSGAITQAEYETLKRKVIFGNSSAASSEPETPVVQNLPPVIPETPVAPKPVILPGNPITPEYIRIPDEPVVYTPLTADEVIIEDTPINQPEEFAEVKRKDWLLTILITLGVLLLLGLISYQLMRDQDSERLTSTSGPDAEEVITDNETETPATEETPEIIRPEQTEGAAPVTDPATATPTTEENPVTTPAALPAISETEALSKINNRLQEYYEDMKTAPFAATSHFAPTVERYYTLTNTSPSAISENINSFHFNEFQDSQSSIEDGSMKVTPLGAEGYEVTYIEHGKAFRKSKNQNQETTARVRVKFNPDFKITYLRQEQLLENKFSDQ